MAACHTSVSCPPWQPSCSSWRAPPARTPASTRSTYDFGGDLSGWSGYVEPGYLLCGRGATAGCPDVSTNRILARAGAAQAVWSQGRWEWTAPPGTTIVGGALAYRTRMRHPQFYARVKMRADGMDWEAAPALLAEQQTTALTDHVVALAGGFRQVGVSLYAHPAAAVVTDAWDDYVTLVRLDVTVDDPTPPGLSWVDGGGLLDGGWHRGRRLRHAQRRRRAVGRERRVAGERGPVVGLDRAEDRLAVPARDRRRPARPLPERGRARRRRAFRHRRRERCQRGTGRGRCRSPCTSTPRLPSPAWWRRRRDRVDVRPLIELDIGDNLSGVLSVSAQIDGDARADRVRGRPCERAPGRARLRTARTRSPGRSPTEPAIAAAGAHASSCPPRRRRRSRRRRREPPERGSDARREPAGGRRGRRCAAPARGPGQGRAHARRAAVRAITARFGATRPRAVIVQLRARARLRIVVRVRCGAVRTLRVRANARGIATRAGGVRGRCDGAHGRRVPVRLLVHIAAPPAAAAAAGASRSGGRRRPSRGSAAGWPRLRGHVVVLEALTATGWRRVGQRARRLLRALRDLVRDRARRPVRPARAGARAGGRGERAVRAHDALTSGTRAVEARRGGIAGGLGAVVPPRAARHGQCEQRPGGEHGGADPDRGHEAVDEPLTAERVCPGA